jgi:predicted nucleic acid-binding protein
MWIMAGKVVEIRSLLARHRRERNIGSRLEVQMFATFQEDVRQRFLICHRLPDALAVATVSLLSLLPDIPLRTLDALHLAIAREIQADTLATADRVMALGAGSLREFSTKAVSGFALLLPDEGGVSLVFFLAQG